MQPTNFNLPQSSYTNNGMVSNYSAKPTLPSSILQPNVEDKRIPRIEIIEQPARTSFRFRYECEGRLSGSIYGVNSTDDNKTFPTIRILGYRGRAIVVVSCVTKDKPHKPHPYSLVGKDICMDGICRVQVTPENMTVIFSKLGIQCVKKKDIKQALKRREQLRVDPFKTGYDHKGIDLNCVRLCFQVFCEGSIPDKFNCPLRPIVSDPIYDKKYASDLVICKLSHYSAPVGGGTEIILLCEKVNKEDIKVLFFEKKDGRTIWEAVIDFDRIEVYKQVAMYFNIPSYRTHDIDHPINVSIQLLRPSDGATSKPRDFVFSPPETEDIDYLKRKRKKLNNNPRKLLLKHMQSATQGAAQDTTQGTAQSAAQSTAQSAAQSAAQMNPGINQHNMLYMNTYGTNLPMNPIMSNMNTMQIMNQQVYQPMFVNPTAQMNNFQTFDTIGNMVGPPQESFPTTPGIEAIAGVSGINMENNFDCLTNNTVQEHLDDLNIKNDFNTVDHDLHSLNTSDLIEVLESERQMLSTSLMEAK